MTNIQEMTNRQLYRRMEFVNGMINTVLNDGENEDVLNRQKTEYMIERHELTSEMNQRGLLIV
jgi:hypothetical protein